MTLLTSKWFLGLLFVLAALIILWAAGKKSVTASIVIDATPAQVWASLTDTIKYEEWNPTFEVVKGKLQQGEEITYLFKENQDKSYEIKTQVNKVIPNELINQSGGVKGILTFNHHYYLVEVDGGTRLQIQEDYKGIAVHFWSPRPVEDAYNRLARALKQRVEQG